MKTIFLLLLILIGTPGDSQPLEGAFRITKAQYGNDTVTAGRLMGENIIKIFKNGYWIAAFFGNPKRPFSGCGGGTYETNDGKYKETLAYYSWDSTAVGRQYIFDYKLTPVSYMQTGYMESEKYPHFLIKEEFKKLESEVPLKNNSLEGVWQLQSAVVDSSGKSVPQPFEQIKVYCYPRFAWAQYNLQTKQFIGAGGGSYQYDGKKLVEHIEYITYDLALGSDFSITVKDGGNGVIQQLGENGWTNETWKKLK